MTSPNLLPSQPADIPRWCSYERWNLCKRQESGGCRTGHTKPGIDMHFKDIIVGRNHFLQELSVLALWLGVPIVTQA